LNGMNLREILRKKRRIVRLLRLFGGLLTAGGSQNIDDPMGGASFALLARA